VSKFDPGTVTPIATSFVLTPPEFIVFSPFPTIRMNRKPEFGPIEILRLDMPAITLTVANYVGRRCRGAKSQQARSPENSFGQTLHKHFSFVDLIETLRMSNNFLWGSLLTCAASEIHAAGS
jgi:hypothetical protein